MSQQAMESGRRLVHWRDLAVVSLPAPLSSTATRRRRRVAAGSGKQREPLVAGKAALRPEVKTLLSAGRNGLMEGPMLRRLAPVTGHE